MKEVSIHFVELMMSDHTNYRKMLFIMLEIKFERPLVY